MICDSLNFYFSLYTSYILNRLYNNTVSRLSSDIKMSRKKNIIYVGGLDTNVTEEILHAAFIPFGDIKSIQIPKDYKESELFLHYY